MLRSETLGEALYGVDRALLISSPDPGEGVVHPGTHIALSIRPTTFAEFTRRNAAVLSGEMIPS